MKTMAFSLHYGNGGGVGVEAGGFSSSSPLKINDGGHSSTLKARAANYDGGPLRSRRRPAGETTSPASRPTPGRSITARSVLIDKSSDVK